MPTLIDVAQQFSDEESCLAYLEGVRWPTGVRCLACGSNKVSKTVSAIKNRRTGLVSKKRYLYQCIEKTCQHQFTATTGTIFHDTHLPLPKWFLAIALLCDAKKSVSAKQLQRHIGGSYKTAWHLNHRIRKAMEEGSDVPFFGVVEMDETYVTGEYDPRRKRARYESQGVVGFVQRPYGGKVSKVRAFPLAKSNKKNLLRVVRENVHEDAKLYTDQAPTYKAFDETYLRYIVNHSNEEWVRGDVHTNSIEGFWSLFKRGLVGSFHAVSIKHLARYLSEFSYRYNNRDARNLFGKTVYQLVRGKRLSFAELVSEPVS